MYTMYTTIHHVSETKKNKTTTKETHHVAKPLGEVATRRDSCIHSWQLLYILVGALEKDSKDNEGHWGQQVMQTKKEEMQVCGPCLFVGHKEKRWVWKHIQPQRGGGGATLSKIA